MNNNSLYNRSHRIGWKVLGCVSFLHIQSFDTLIANLMLCRDSISARWGEGIVYLERCALYSSSYFPPITDPQFLFRTAQSEVDPSSDLMKAMVISLF